MSDNMFLSPGNEKAMVQFTSDYVNPAENSSLLKLDIWLQATIRDWVNKETSRKHNYFFLIEIFKMRYSTQLFLTIKNFITWPLLFLLVVDIKV